MSHEYTNTCPACASKNYRPHGKLHIVPGDYIYTYFKCEECEAEWTDCYEFTERDVTLEYQKDIQIFL